MYLKEEVDGKEDFQRLVSQEPAKKPEFSGLAPEPEQKPPETKLAPELKTKPGSRKDAKGRPTLVEEPLTEPNTDDLNKLAQTAGGQPANGQGEKSVATIPPPPETPQEAPKPEPEPQQPPTPGATAPSPIPASNQGAIEADEHKRMADGVLKMGIAAGFTKEQVIAYLKKFNWLSAGQSQIMEMSHRKLQGLFSSWEAKGAQLGPDMRAKMEQGK
jgi:hypothetical protein